MEQKKNKYHAAEKILYMTKSNSKTGVDKKKACDKIKGTGYIVLSLKKILIR